MAEQEGQLQEPLLRTEGQDVETGNAGPSPEENAKLAKEGAMSWQELVAFFLDPSHWMVSALVAYAVIAVLLLVYLFVDLGNFDVTHKIGIVAILTVCGISFAAYQAFLSEQLKVEVKRFYCLNQTLTSNKVRLEETCRDLRDGVNRMQDEIEQFQKLKEQMAAYSDQVGGGFKGVLDDATAVLDKMKDQLNADVSDTLSNYAQSFENSDGNFDFTEEEFNNFKRRLPKGFESVSFEEVSKGNSTATFEDIQALIDKAIESLKAPA